MPPLQRSKIHDGGKKDYPWSLHARRECVSLVFCAAAFGAGFTDGCTITDLVRAIGANSGFFEIFWSEYPDVIIADERAAILALRHIQSG